VSQRARLPNRRANETFAFECNGLKYSMTVARYPNGDLAKSGSHSDSAAKDSAVVASIAFQHGVPASVIRKALMRDSQGHASSPLGAALDIIAGENRR